MMKTKIKRGVMLIALAIMSCLVFGLVACTKPEPSEPVLSGISITNKTELHNKQDRAHSRMACG